jgi:conjugative transfer pilus assembly protein TraH
MRKILLLAIFFNNAAYAGIGEDLGSFFNAAGTTSNVTTSGAHRDQSAGYYSGGGISLRNRVKNAQLATLQFPSINAGCGGIDMFLGGFSHISKDALVSALRNIGTNAAGYAFKLSLKTIAPMIDGVIEDLNTLATKINQANINSCEVATTLLDRVWPKSDLAGRHACTSSKSKQEAQDWASARQHCGAGGGRESSSSENGADYRDMFIEEFNIAWEVIKRNQFLKSDTDLSHLCMTLSGTIVSYKEGDKRKILTYPSRADHDDLIKVLFEGGSTNIYACRDGAKCLKIETRKPNIPSARAFTMKVRKTLNDIMEKAVSDRAFSPQEIVFIENVKLPLYKMINVMAAHKRADFDLRDFTEIVAVDFIHQYIVEILDVMLAEAANLRNVQISEKEISLFIKQLQRAKSAVDTKRMNAYEQVNQALIMIETTKTDERKVENSFYNLQRESN